MAEKPVAERLQLKPGRRLAVIHPTLAILAAIGSGAPRAEIDAADVVLLCVADRAGLQVRLPPLLVAIRPQAILWIAYPKLSSGLRGDLSRDIIHAMMPGFGLDTVAQIAIDADWSAMRMKRAESKSRPGCFV